MDPGIPGVPAASLHDVARRCGLFLRGRSGRRTNWTPTLEALCRQADIEVRRDPVDGTRLIRASDAPALERRVREHFARVDGGRDWEGSRPERDRPARAKEGRGEGRHG